MKYFINNKDAGAIVYYAQVILKDKELVGPLSTIMNVAQILAMFFVAGFIKRYDKRNVIVAGSLLTIIGYVAMLIAGTSVSLLFIGNAIKGIGGAGIASCMFAMVSDTIEYGEWRTGCVLKD